ncbi:MAG: hypothetical protein WCR61_07245 [Bacteroidales bacterium]
MTNIQELKRGAITQQEYDSRRAELTKMDFKDQYKDHLLRNDLVIICLGSSLFKNLM